MQYVLHLGQMGINFLVSLRTGENLLHINASKLWFLLHAARQGEEQKKQQDKRDVTGQGVWSFIMASMLSLPGGTVRPVRKIG